MSQRKYLSFVLLALSGLGINATYAATLQALTDEQLSETTGQALMSLTYTAPTDTSNLESQRVNGAKNVGFYKLGLEAEVSINANIKKLQLGCGGMNGAGDCDIDIDNLSLSGLKLNSDGNVAMTNEERASSDAVLTNPFLEFAIKNPDKASTREIVGLRLSADKIVGLLSAGTNNNTPNGINTLSGFMQISGYGTATTAQSTFGLKNSEQVTSYADVNVLPPLCTSGCGSNQKYTAGNVNSDNKGIVIPSLKADFVINNAQVLGNRMKSANVLAVTDIPAIPLTETAGQLGVHMADCIKILGICAKQDTFIKLNTNLVNLKGDIQFSEGLGYIHNIPISSAGYLSLQAGQIQWPGAKEVAQNGWWLSMQDPINLGKLNPQGEVDISSVYSQVASILGTYLATAPYKVSVDSADGINALFGSGITKTLPNIDLSGQRVNIPLSNLILTSQNVVSNCYGSLKFC